MLRINSKLREYLGRQGFSAAQLGFQFVIIAFGVWLAIAMGNRNAERDSERKAVYTLGLVLEELWEDRQEMTGVLQAQQTNQPRLAQLIKDIGSGNPIDSAWVGASPTSNATFFPRRAGYTMLQTSGQLQYIRNPALRTQLAKLYDRDYVRLYDAGKFLDQTALAFRWALLDYWSPVRHAPTGVPHAGDIAISRAQRFAMSSAAYQALLEHEIDKVTSVIGLAVEYVRSND